MVLCVEITHSSLGDRKDIFTTHFIVLIKSEVLTFPIFVIFVRICLPEVVVLWYVVGFIYVQRKLGFASFITVQYYGVRK